jgi:hypothetical protein
VNALDQYRDAAIGWYELALHRPDWRGKFVTTRDGLLVALAGYFSIVIVAILVQGLTIGVPGVLELIAAVGVNALPVVGVVLALLVTRQFLRLTVPIFDMLVPGIHALTMLLIAGFALSLLGGVLSIVLLALLAYLFYRGGREILGLGVALAVSYAGLTIVLLVALPASIYMLLAPGPGGPI